MPQSDSPERTSRDEAETTVIRSDSINTVGIPSVRRTVPDEPAHYVG